MIKKMEPPTTLASTLTEFINRHEPGSRMHGIGTELLRAHGRNQDRRAAVLRHDDLAKRVTTVLGLRRPEHWNGYIPAAVALDDDGGLLRLLTSMRDGRQHVQFNAAGQRSIGTVPNNSPERGELVEISREAWNREHELPEPAKPGDAAGAASAAVPSSSASSSAFCPAGDGLTPPASSPNGHALTLEEGTP